MAESTLLPDPTCLHLLQLESSGKLITATVTTTTKEACCPLCGSRSEKVHSHYQRVLADLPWMSCAVRLKLHTRRFFCTNTDCQRKIFTERLSGVVAPYAHKTLRLAEVLTVIAFALGGEAGRRLGQEIGLLTSPDTFLRLIHTAAEEPHPTPRILGVDDFSFLRARKFGTILIDLEKHVPIEILPDREAETLAAWLKEHPGVELISRDRGGAYADGARQGAPQARQVADRFHLLVNLSETLEAFFLNKRTALKEAAHDPVSPSPVQTESRPPRLSQKGKTKKQEAKSEALHQQRVERYEKVHELWGKGATPPGIADQLNMPCRTVYHYLKMTEPPERRRVTHRKGRPKKVAPFQEYLLKRWQEGCRNARQLHRELTEEYGYTASYANVERFLMQFRTKAHKFKQEEPGAILIKKTTISRPPTARQVSRWITLPKDRRLDWQNAYLERLFQADPTIAQTASLMVDFATMLRERQGERLDEWLALVEAQDVAELRSFATGLRRDYDAVKNGLTEIWSNGQVEGQVHRLKLLKRQAYGRASFETLRKRVLRRA